MFVHPKDLVPAKEQKSVLYCVPCNGSPKKYFGQTGCSLKHQLAEHHRALKKEDVAISALAHSAHHGCTEPREENSAYSVHCLLD